MIKHYVRDVLFDQRGQARYFKIILIWPFNSFNSLIPNVCRLATFIGQAPRILFISVNSMGRPIRGPTLAHQKNNKEATHVCL